jgi:RNA-binding protein Musashi
LSSRAKLSVLFSKTVRCAYIQIEIKKAQPRGSGNLVKNFNGPQGGGGGGNRFNGNVGNNMGGGMMGMGGGGGGGFDPNAMAMMYQNMMKGQGGGMGGGMGMGFDPSAMAMMYQNMMKSESTLRRRVNEDRC